jgi:NADH-quinone oxidoreductase subunit E
MESNYLKFKSTCRILKENNFDKSRLIPILQAIQEEYKYLPEEILAFVASALKISPAKVFSVVTFFTYFTLKPKGKYVIKFCDGTACHVKNSTSLIDAARNKLGLKAGENSTKDMLFTLEAVSCLGACSLGPVVLINETVHGQVTPEQVVKLIDDIIKQDGTK